MQNRLTLIKLIKNSCAHSRKSHHPLCFLRTFEFIFESFLHQDIACHGRRSRSTWNPSQTCLLRVYFLLKWGGKGKQRQRQHQRAEWWVNTTNNLMGTQERKKERRAPSGHNLNELKTVQPMELLCIHVCLNLLRCRKVNRTFNLFGSADRSYVVSPWEPDYCRFMISRTVARLN